MYPNLFVSIHRKMEGVIVFILIGMILAVCWKFRITPSLLAFVTVIALTMGCMAFVGTEKFTEPATEPAITNELLDDAGLIRPSLFNCTSEIGRTPEMNYLYTIPIKDMK